MVNCPSSGGLCDLECGKARGLGLVFENSPDRARRNRAAAHSAPGRSSSEEDILRVCLPVRLKGRNLVKNCKIVQHALSMSPERTELLINLLAVCVVWSFSSPPFWVVTFLSCHGFRTASGTSACIQLEWVSLQFKLQVGRILVLYFDSLPDTALEVLDCKKHAIWQVLLLVLCNLFSFIYVCVYVYACPKMLVCRLTDFFSIDSWGFR